MIAYYVCESKSSGLTANSNIQIVSILTAIQSDENNRILINLKKINKKKLYHVEIRQS